MRKRYILLRSGYQRPNDVGSQRRPHTRILCVLLTLAVVVSGA